MQSALQVDSEIRVASKPALRLPSLPPGASDDSDLVDAIMARPPAPGRRDLAAGSEPQPGGSAVLYSEIQNLLFSNACTKIFTVYVQNFSPFWGLSFSPFFYPPVEVESVSERANYTLLFKTLVRIHFLPPFFIPFLPPFFIPFLPPFFYHQPRFLQQCVNVARPCPQCKNLDNSANNMNRHLLVVLRQVVFIAYSILVLNLCTRRQALSPV